MRPAKRLHAEALKEPQPDVLFALAEISYHRGRRSRHGRCADSVKLLLPQRGYSYHFIFDFLDAKTSAPGGGAFEIFRSNALRLACDLYNAGLSKCIRAAQRVGRLDAREQLTLSTADKGGFTLSVHMPLCVEAGRILAALEFAEDFGGGRTGESVIALTAWACR